MSSAKAGDGDDDLSDWKSVKLKFAPEPGKVSLTFSMSMAIYVEFCKTFNSFWRLKKEFFQWTTGI